MRFILKRHAAFLLENGSVLMSMVMASVPIEKNFRKLKFF